MRDAPADADGVEQPDEEESSPLDADTHIANQMQTSTPCSCDCCTVQKMLPMDQIPMPNGQKNIDSACMKATSDPTDASGGQGICPDQCQPSNDNQILSSATGQIDYNRFCNYNCQPGTDRVGDLCVLFDKEYYEAAKTDGGNGKEVYPEPLAGLGSGLKKAVDEGAVPIKSDQEQADVGDSQARAGEGDQEEDVALAPEDEKKAEAPKVQIIYDMRKLIAERLRSEAGANVASAAAAAERVRINEWSTKQDLDKLKKLRTQYAAMGGKVEEKVAGVEAAKNQAEEAEANTKKNLAAGRIFATKMVNEVRSLTDAAIRGAVAPCVEKAANDKAEAKGLDKPKDWVKVVAARAANPYQKDVTDAVMRTSDYKNLADGLMDQAYGAQKQANTLINHVNVLEAQGDLVGATIEKKQVNNLLAKARGLQKQAAGYWNTAQSTRETIPKWQMAAQQAAAYSAWEYANNAKAFR